MLYCTCPDPSRHLALLSFSHGIISSVRHLLLCAQAQCTGSGLGYKSALRSTQRSFCDSSLLPEAGSEFVTAILVICRKKMKGLGKGVESPCALSSTGRLEALGWPCCGMRFGVSLGRCVILRQGAYGTAIATGTGGHSLPAILQV